MRHLWPCGPAHVLPLSSVLHVTAARTLFLSLPAGTVLSFVEQNTTYVEGVGDVCSLAAFDFQASNGSQGQASPAARKLRLFA